MSRDLTIALQPGEQERNSVSEKKKKKKKKNAVFLTFKLSLCFLSPLSFGYYLWDQNLRDPVGQSGRARPQGLLPLATGTSPAPGVEPNSCGLEKTAGRGEVHPEQRGQGARQLVHGSSRPLRPSPGPGSRVKRLPRAFACGPRVPLCGQQLGTWPRHASGSGGVHMATDSCRGGGTHGGPAAENRGEHGF